MRGKITECWLAKTEGIFLNHARALLVIKRACLLDADWQRGVIADEIIFTTMASRFVEADGTLISFRECNSLKNFALYVIKK